MNEQAPITFRGFDELGETRIYYTSLPHWRQAGCTYFVTFRLGDSLPATVFQRIQQQADAWLKTKGVHASHADGQAALGQLSDDDRREYIRRYRNAIDRALERGYGECILRDRRYARIVAGALDFFDGQRVCTGDYVVMPNHVHALLTPTGEHQLEDLLGSIKNYSTKQINKISDHTGSLWQRDNYDHIVRAWDQLEAFRNYIAANPKKAKLRPGEYIHKTAIYISP